MFLAMGVAMALSLWTSGVAAAKKSSASQSHSHGKPAHVMGHVAGHKIA